MNTPSGAIHSTYQNWHGNLPKADVDLFVPQTALGVRDALEHCFGCEERLLTIGRTFSLSHLLVAGKYVLDPQLLCKVSRVPDDCVGPEGAGRVFFAVQAGAYITDVNHALGLLGFALPTSGAASNQSIAGATSTGTHGASTYGAAHDFIRAVVLLTSPAETVLLRQSAGMFTPELPAFLGATLGGPPKPLGATVEPAAFGAAVVGLGALGVVHTLVVEVEKLYQVVGTRFDAPIGDARVWKALHTMDFTELAGQPPGTVGPPFNVAVTFSPYSQGVLGINGAFASFLWKVPPTEAYPMNFPVAHPRMGSALERWAASISASLPGVITGAIIAAHIHDDEWDPSSPAFPGFVFGPTTIRTSNGRSTEIIVPAQHAHVAVRTVLDTLAHYPTRLVGLVGLRYVAGTKSGLLAMNQGSVACIEIPCLNQNPTATSAVFAACWSAVRLLGIPYTFHWGQENPHDAESVRSYYKENVTRWLGARAALLSPIAAKVFRNPLTDAAGLT
jgi:FAD/FMN-containing dehydrogenase